VVGKSGKEDATKRAAVSNNIFNGVIPVLLPCFGELEELTAKLYAPTVTLGSTRTTCAIPIDDYLKDLSFSSETLLRMRNLQKIVVVGQSCLNSDYENERPVQNGKVEHLQALLQPAQLLKDSLTGHGQHVDIRVRLLCSRQCDERILKPSITVSGDGKGKEEAGRTSAANNMTMEEPSQTDVGTTAKSAVTGEERVQRLTGSMSELKLWDQYQLRANTRRQIRYEAPSRNNGELSRRQSKGSSWR
jgi:hypothetical protein